MKTFTISNTRKGFGLLEVILVFAIVLGASVVLFNVFNGAHERANAQHDRDLVTAMAGSISTLFPKTWTSDNGPTVSNAFYSDPVGMAGPSCAFDSDIGGPGCVSALTGQSFGVGEVDYGTAGVAFSISIAGASEDDCNAFLAGGAGSLGAVGAYTGPNPYSGAQGLHHLATQTDVAGICHAAVAAQGGNIDYINLVFANAKIPFPYQ